MTLGACVLAVLSVRSSGDVVPGMVFVWAHVEFKVVHAPYPHDLHAQPFTVSYRYHRRFVHGTQLVQAYSISKMRMLVRKA